MDEKNDAAMHEEDEFRWCRSIEACMPGKKFPGAFMSIRHGEVKNLPGTAETAEATVNSPFMELQREKQQKEKPGKQGYSMLSRLF